MSVHNRRRRSNETITAITYQMEYVLKEYDIDLMLLADARGLLIAFAGDESAAQTFAVFAGQLARGEEPDPALFDALPGLQTSQIISEPLHLEDSPLFLCAVMAPEVESAHGYDRARTGIKRIYRTTGSQAATSST